LKQVNREIEATEVPSEGVILPSQFYGRLAGDGLSSEGRLMLAVLVDAINILRGWNGLGGRRKRRVFGEAAHWVNLKGTQNPFSFDSVCEAVGIDSDMARDRLRGLAAGHAGIDGLGARLRMKEFARPQKMSANRVRPSTRARRHVAAVSDLCA
jgi:hypothetical protein